MQSIFNPERGYAIILAAVGVNAANLIFYFPESICIQKLGKIRAGQVIEFQVNDQAGHGSYIMINGRKYKQGRHIIHEDGEMLGVIVPALGSAGTANTTAPVALGTQQSAPSWLKGYIEEA
jgi:hypothetical protein